MYYNGLYRDYNIEFDYHIQVCKGTMGMVIQPLDVTSLTGRAYIYIYMYISA